MLYRSPEFLYFLFAVPVLAFFYFLSFRWKRKMLRLFGKDKLTAKLSSMTSQGRQTTKAVLVVLAFVFLLFALARPMWGTRMEIVKRKGIDIVIALDVSNSMLAEDIKPDRIKRAKYEIGRLIDKLKGDRIGLVAFAGVAFTQCPVTTDYGAVKMYLDILEPSAIEAQGTAIGEAIRKSRRCFNQNENKYKVIILITDGEDNEGSPVEEAKKASEEGVVVFTLGIGTKGGVPIPMEKAGGNIVYKKDQGGNTVLTTLNEEVLEEVASAAGGRYFHSTGSGLELDRIYEEINKIEKKELQAQIFGRYNEQFGWPLAVALILLWVEYFLSSRKKKNTVWEGRFE
jgi:Ca-activated chloride channel homolog